MVAAIVVQDAELAELTTRSSPTLGLDYSRLDDNNKEESLEDATEMRVLPAPTGVTKVSTSQGNPAAFRKATALEEGAGTRDLQALQAKVRNGRFAYEQARCQSWRLYAAAWTDESTEWLKDHLQTLRGSVAVLLPGTEGPMALALAAGKPLLRGLRERAVADTSFCGSPRRLWILELAAPMRGEQVHAQVRWLRQLAENATQAHKPEKGPWVWPLHDNGVAVAVMVANVVLRDARIAWWRHLLWGLQLLPLPGGCQGERLLRKHYGQAVSYTFSWSSLYVHALWILTAAMIILSLAASAEPGDTGSRRGIAWNVLQFGTVVWAKCLADHGQSKEQVLQAGGATSVRQRRARAAAPSSPSGSLGAQPQPKLRGYHSEDLRADREEAIRRDAHRRKSSEGPPEETLVEAELSDTEALAVVAPEAAPQAPGRTSREAWGRAVSKARMGLMHLVLEKHRNWDYKPMTGPQAWRRKWLAMANTTIVITFFTVVCVLVLAGFVQLNTYLAYVWGRCMDPEVRAQAKAVGNQCRDPQFIHGFKGWLAEVSSDIALAVIFDVLLGAIAKAVADALVRFRNFHFMADRRYREVLLSLLIEVLSKVGMYAIIAFVFLPRWVPHRGQSFSVDTHCRGLIDHEVCKAFAGCDTRDEPQCCSATLLCIAQHLEFEDRRVLFEKSVKGPFVVAPFVRILVTVIIPWVAGVLEQLVSLDARDVPVGQELSHDLGIAPAVHESRCLRCLRGFATPIVRILALIFHKDGDSIGGCGYLARGWPFGPLDHIRAGQLAGSSPARSHAWEQEEVRKSEAEGLMRGAQGQVARKPFEPMDELLELKMSFLFVTFFAPIMPFGLLPTLVARLLEVRFKATKLLFVRRSSWPEEAELLHKTQDVFTHFAVLVAVVWHTGLVLVTYNKDVRAWGGGKTAGVWLACAAGVGVAVYAASALFHLTARLLYRHCPACSKLCPGKEGRQGKSTDPRALPWKQAEAKGPAVPPMLS